MPRTAPLSASAFDAIHESFDAPEVEPDCCYCGAEGIPLADVDGEMICSACVADLAAEAAADRIAPSLATYAVARTEQSERFNPRTSHVVARFLTKREADRLSAILREADPEAVFTTFASPLAAQMEAAGFTPERAEAYAPEATHADGIQADAVDLAGHMHDHGARFDVRRKVRESARYSLTLGTDALRIPSKLSGTSTMQDRAARVARHMDASGAVSLATVLHVTPDGIAVLAAPNGEAREEDASRRGAVLVGYIQEKHAAWLTPLLNANAGGTVTREGTPVRVRITAVTGGTPERPTRGVNVVLLGTGAAVRGLWRQMEREEAEADAYESGNHARIEARIA